MDEQKNAKMMGPSMSYLEHLAELRKRLFRSVAILIITSAAAFFWVEIFADFLLAPAGDLEFIFLSPPDLFMTYVKLSLSVGLIVSLPVILFEVWMFISPALSTGEKRSIFFSLCAGSLLFLLGASFAYYVIIPFTIKFFLGYESSRISPMLSITEYFRFLFNMGLSFGAAFELPIVSGLLGALGILKTEFLVGGRRIALLLIFIVAAIITPPDIVSQVLLAIPMLGLYELSILILKYQGRKRRKKAEKELQQAT
jgi:sec-independent protein translocase protein TatC